MSEKTKIVCIGCPKGCGLTVVHEDKSIIGITGYHCNIGLEYAKSEFTAPCRVLTSTVRITGGELAMIPVKTKQAIPKEKIFDCARKICELQVEAPVKLGTVICKNIGNTNVDLIATRDVATR